MISTNQKKTDKSFPLLVVDDKKIYDEGLNVADSIEIVRNLINTPASDMTPYELVKQASNVAKNYNAKVTVYKDKKLKDEWPAVYGVGKGGDAKPCVADIVYKNQINTQILQL